MRAASALVCLLIISACATIRSPDEFVGTWIAMSIGGRPVIPENRPSLILRSDGVVAGSTGCNGYGGRYQIANGRLLTTDVEQTIVSCGSPNATPQEIGAQEHAFMDVLAHGPQLSLNRGNLVLTGRDGASVEFARRDE